ncbi:bifunctional diguanylate cyclase/phosphodiesterase [Novosphingobium piscinae]|uniref:putative bifunctional diguanylate cyclase/phosphodiesterase n=1 Tax=Novosphingobium piscinae TaxID=1507448 RepID=UPI0031B5DC0E
MKHLQFTIPEGDEDRVLRLERQLAREREARLAAEAIAEKGLRDLYTSQQRLALLQRITERANSSDDFQTAAAYALKDICTEMEWDFGNSYVVPDDGSAALACDCWFLASPDGLDPFVEVSRSIRFAAGIGLPGRVLTETRAHWVQDVREDTNFLRLAIARECGVVAGCAFPIMVGKQVVAIFEFFSRRTITPDEGMVETMAQIGIQLGRVVERVRAREALLHDTLHDSLTGLPNRVLLADRATQAFERRSTGGPGLAVLVIDLNGFKTINDKHGHHLGDEVLVAVSRRFSAALGSWQKEGGSEVEALLARTGGDEFVVLLAGTVEPTLAQHVAELLQSALDAPFRAGEEEAPISASIGIALCAPAYGHVDQVIRDADLAMYEAKSGDHANIVMFTPSLGNRVRNRMALEQEIREAISARQFVLHYQPIVGLSSGQVSGFEALVRWNHPLRGLISPNEFIPIAEQNGSIVSLGEWVLQEACAALARLHRTMPAGFLPSVAVNIAPVQFLQPDFIAQLRAVLRETGVPPACLKLEVTEGVAIIDSERTRRTLEQCRDIGVRTGLDDFGTGYSSLSYLHSLPFDTLKIDRSFIAAMERPKSLSIVRTILDLSKKLGLSVVAEGIETDRQSLSLAAWGCEFGQGYLLGRPEPEATAFRFNPARPIL